MTNHNLNPHDQLACIRARARLLELALLGADGSGMSLEDETYRDALTQQVQDIARGLDHLAAAMKNKMAAT